MAEKKIVVKYQQQNLMLMERNLIYDGKKFYCNTCLKIESETESLKDFVKECIKSVVADLKKQNLLLNSKIVQLKN